ncbi:hypothetical protein HOY80DRAFT_1045638 [Tuber brumale]|nr:hypothetical protein HOY80DRAFT_1045638 [Tuber brumale]
MTLRQIIFCIALVAVVAVCASPIRQLEENRPVLVRPGAEDLMSTYFKRQTQPKPPPQLDPALTKTKNGELWQPLRVNEKPKTADPLQRVKQNDVNNYIN